MLFSFRKSIRESATSPGTSGGAIGNNMTGSTASASSTSSSYRRPPDLNNTSMTTSVTGPTTNDNLAVGGGGGGPGDIKPRSLRFTWSMKTTSSMDPSDMMKEIRKVKKVF
jgi:MAP/microtubule affinity-regulating kinase